MKARERRTDALRAGNNAAANLRRRIRRSFAVNDVWPVCAFCGTKVLPSQADIDHIIPLYKGGSDTDDNVQVLCSSRGMHAGCHDIKTAMDADRAPF